MDRVHYVKDYLRKTTFLLPFLRKRTETQWSHLRLGAFLGCHLKDLLKEGLCVKFQDSRSPLKAPFTVSNTDFDVYFDRCQN